jgi:hypothetical protein
MSLVWTARPTAVFASNTIVADIMSVQTMYCTASGSYKQLFVVVRTFLFKPVEPLRPDKNQKRAAKATRTVQRKKRNNNKPLTDDLFEDSDDDDIDGLEEVMKVYKVSKDGMAGCHVGYLPK